MRLCMYTIVVGDDSDEFTSSCLVGSLSAKKKEAHLEVRVSVAQDL